MLSFFSSNKIAFSRSASSPALSMVSVLVSLVRSSLSSSVPLLDTVVSTSLGLLGDIDDVVVDSALRINEGLNQVSTRCWLLTVFIAEAN